MNRKSLLNNTVLIISIFLLGIFMLPRQVRAEPLITVNIPVQQVVETKGQSSDYLFSYQLVSLDNLTPMPDDQSIYTFKLKGNTSIKIPIEYSQVGIYQYQLVQLVPANKPKEYHFDTQVIIIEVHLNYGRDGSLIPTLIAKNSQGYKLEKISFTNSHVPKKTEKPVDKAKQTELLSKSKLKRENLPQTDEIQSLMLFMVGIGILWCVLSFYFKKKQSSK